MRSVTHFLRYYSLKCSKQTFKVRSAIVNSFTSSVFPSETNGETEKKLFLFCGRFHSLLVAFRNSKTRRHHEIKQTRPSTKQDFFRGRLSKQNTEASLASLSCNSFRAPTEWSAIFAFGVWETPRMRLRRSFLITPLNKYSCQYEHPSKHLSYECFWCCHTLIPFTLLPLIFSALFKVKQHILDYCTASFHVSLLSCVNFLLAWSHLPGHEWLMCQWKCEAIKTK